MTYEPSFNERKATHIAAYLLQKSEGTMYLLKLMKLLYLVDRKALMCLGDTVTNDTYVSMEHGPVLSNTYDLMGGMVKDTSCIWNAMIIPSAPYKLSIVDECEVSQDALSKAELEIADEIFDEYGHIPRFDLVLLTHELPEWNDPRGSSIPILYETILKEGGYDDDDIDSIISGLEEQKATFNILNGEVIDEKMACAQS